MKNCFTGYFSHFFFSSLVKSLVEVTRFLLTLPNTGTKYLLSDNLSQDCLENCFDKLRSRGGWCTQLQRHVWSLPSHGGYRDL